MFASFELWSGGMVQHADRKKYPRSKTGCLTCRRNKKKCGEERPTCRRCLQRGYKDCTWPDYSSHSESSLKQQNGNSGPTSLHLAQPSSGFLPDMFDESASIPTAHAWQVICHANRAIHGAYFDDHYTIVVPLFPLLAEFPAYAYAWLALGAAQLAQQNPAPDSPWWLMALSYHSKALHGLRRHLESSAEPQEWALCSTLLLHIFEKFGDELRPPSDAHVRSARRYFLRRFIQCPPTNMRHTLQLESLIYRVAVTSLFKKTEKMGKDYTFLDQFIEIWEASSVRGSLWQHSLWIGLQPPIFNAIFKLSSLLQCVPLNEQQMSEVGIIEQAMAHYLELHAVLPSHWAQEILGSEHKHSPAMTLVEQSHVAHCIFGVACWIVMTKLKNPKATQEQEPIRELARIGYHFLNCVLTMNFFSPVLIWPTIAIGLAASTPEEQTIATLYITRLADVSGPRASKSVLRYFAQAWGRTDDDRTPGIDLLLDSAALATVFI